MPVDLPPLVGILRGNITDFAAKMGEAKAISSETTSSSSSMFNKLAGVGKAALMVGCAAMLGVAGAAIELEHHAEESGQAAYEMSEKFGLGADMASKWIAVGQQVGVSSETIGKGFQFLDKNVGALAMSQQAGIKWTKAQTEPWKALGISINDASGHVKSSNTLMLEAAGVFAKMQDGPEKAALAIKLFGRSGTDLIPVLNMGQQGIQSFMDAATASGEALSGPQVQAAHQAFLAHKQFDAAITGVTNRLSVGLLPAATAIFGYLTKTGIPSVEHLVGWFQKNTEVTKMVAAAIGGVLLVAVGAYTVSMIGAAAATIAATWPLLAIIAAVALLAAGVVYAYTHWGWFRNVVNAVGKDLGVFMGWLGKVVPPIWKGFTKDVSDVWNGLKNFASWISSTLGPIFDKIGQGAKTAGQFLNWLNPFAKHSPSLVENVQAGTTMIAGHYQSMARSVQGSMTSLGGSAALTGSALAGAGAAGGPPALSSGASVSLARNYQLKHIEDLLMLLTQQNQQILNRRGSLAGAWGA